MNTLSDKERRNDERSDAIGAGHQTSAVAAFLPAQLLPEKHKFAMYKKPLSPLLFISLDL